MRSAIFAAAAREWARMRDDYGIYLESHIAAAVEATNGTLFSRAALSAGVTETRLFAAPAHVAAAWASEELQDFWRANPRVTVTEFEQAWVEAP